MPDATERRLEQLLSFADDTDPGDDLFVVDVMRRVRRARRLRRLILLGFGGIGALFGLAGALMLSEPIGQLFTGAFSGFELAQAALFTVGGLAFYLWFMNDDLALQN
jgi:hypothetical protein